MVALTRLSANRRALNSTSSHNSPLAPQRLPGRSHRENSFQHSAQTLKGHSGSQHTIDVGTAVIKQATTFTLFPQLPLELRQRIWGMVPEARLITIAPEFNRNSSDWEIHPRAKLVPTLYVCKEFRDWALRGYDLVEDDNIIGACTYVDWSRDRIFFDLPSEEFPRLGTVLRLFIQGLCRVQSLALRRKWYFRPDILDILSQFSQLRNLMFVGENVLARRGCGDTSLIITDLGRLYPDARGSLWIDHARWMCDNLYRLPLLRSVSMSMVT